MSDKITAPTAMAGNAFSDIEDIIADIAAGKMVIMVDDENRENEGDLLMAAAKVSAADINYMATYGRGLICLTLSRKRCAQLRLPLIAQLEQGESSAQAREAVHRLRERAERVMVEEIARATPGLELADLDLLAFVLGESAPYEDP